VGLGIRLTSLEYPNIEFAQHAGVPPSYAETNNAPDSTLPGWDARYNRYAKLPLARGDLSMWWIRYRDTGQRLPDDEALKYINKFIDSGFMIEIFAAGTVSGISRVRPIGFTAEVTRLVKDK
jgi:hypothetical protein